MNNKVEKILKGYFKRKVPVSIATIVMFLMSNEIVSAITVSENKTFSSIPAGENLEVKNTSIYDNTNLTVELEKGIKINPTNSDYAIIIEGTGKGVPLKDEKIEAIQTILHSKGDLSINSKNGVSMKGHKATFKIDGNNSEILADNTAIYFGAKELYSSDSYSENREQVMEFDNIKIRNKSDTTLIIADVSGIDGKYSDKLKDTVYKNIYSTNAELILKGKGTLVEANPNAWLAETRIKDAYISEEGKFRLDSAELNIKLDNYAKVKGLVNKEYNKSRERKKLASSLGVAISNNSVWELAPKQDLIEQKSTVSFLSLYQNGILNVGKNKTSDNKAEYKITTLSGEDYSTGEKLLNEGATGERLIVPISKYIENEENEDENYESGVILNMNGIINMANDSFEDKLILEGDYMGYKGNLLVNTLWNSHGDTNSGNSKSDLLHITGDVYGETKVIAVSKDGKAGYIDGTIGEIEADLNKNSAVVVKVDGRSFKEKKFENENENENERYNETVADEIFENFTGTARTKGAGQVQIASRKLENGGKEYFWTLTALTGGEVDKKSEEVAAIVVNTYNENKNNNSNSDTENTNNSNTTSSPNSQNNINSENKNTTNGEIIYLLNPEVSAYTQMPKINMDMAYSSLRTLHERRGENSLVFEENKNMNKLWARTFKEKNKLKGKERFEYKADINGVQVGYDFNKTYANNGGYRLNSGYFSYVEADTKFYDRYKAENGKIVGNKHTGNGEADMFALGLTSTKYNKDGLYTDLVSQLAFYRNKYKMKDIKNSKQKGYGLSLSGEIGKKINLTESSKGKFVLEPQAQLTYQYLDLKEFKDEIREINSNEQYGLRGRIGLRLAYNDFSRAGTSIYTVANIIEDFLNPKEITIHNDKIKEKYSKTLGNIGLGIQLPILEKSYVYGDFRYEHSLRNNDYKGYYGTIGIKYTW